MAPAAWLAAAHLDGVDRNHDSGHDFDSGWAWERAEATANVIEGSSRGADAAEGKLGGEGWSGCSSEQIPAIVSERVGGKRAGEYPHHRSELLRLLDFEERRRSGELAAAPSSTGSNGAAVARARVLASGNKAVVG